MHLFSGDVSTETVESPEAEPPRLSSSAMAVDCDTRADVLSADAFAVEEGHGFGWCGDVVRG